MNMILALVTLGLSLAGCASSRVSIDIDSCNPRGVLDGIKISDCEIAKKVK
jgi:hypothetical protein